MARPWAPRVLDLAGLEQEAQALWRELPAGGVVWLSGELGSGKTAFVQALARAAGAARASSPSFALLHQYASPEGVLAHADCYRLRMVDEARDLDLAAVAVHARALVIEWPERAGAHAPPPFAHYRFTHVERSDQRSLERVA